MKTLTDISSQIDTMSNIDRVRLDIFGGLGSARDSTPGYSLAELVKFQKFRGVFDLGF